MDNLAGKNSEITYLEFIEIICMVFGVLRGGEGGSGGMVHRKKITSAEIVFHKQLLGAINLGLTHNNPTC